MGKHDIPGYTGYKGVYRVYSTTRVNMGTQEKGVYRVYSITRVNIR